MQDARSVSNSPDTCVGQGGFCFSKDRRRVSFGPANSIQWSVAFRDLFVSRVFKLGEMDGLKDLLINGWLTTIAFKEFPNVPQQLIWTWLIFHLPLFQGTGNSVLNSPCVFSLIGSVLFCAQGHWGWLTLRKSSNSRLFPAHSLIGERAPWWWEPCQCVQGSTLPCVTAGHLHGAPKAPGDASLEGTELSWWNSSSCVSGDRESGWQGRTGQLSQHLYPASRGQWEERWKKHEVTKWFHENIIIMVPGWF